MTTAVIKARGKPDGTGHQPHRTQMDVPAAARYRTVASEVSLTYRLTQVLSALGYFRSYLHRFNRADDSYCPYCMDPNDSAEHTLFVMVEILRRSPVAEDVEELLCGPRIDALHPGPGFWFSQR